ncbi:MAG: OPT/YSL family transporter [Myxococcales bacterium]|nr:OPT/YSL family transporter [Myxococcales bacterium]
MALFQPAPSPEDLDRNKPLEIPPEEVLTFDEKTWYERAYRGDDAPQLTVRAVAMGTGLGFLLAFTNVYIGLKTGWHLGVAITACILSFSIWNTLQKAGVVKGPMSILETNCMQSTASAAGYATGNTLATAIPALLILSVTKDNPTGTHLPAWVLGAWVLLLATLGVFLAIPMKRNMINQERLKFPSGVAAAVTLQSLYSKGTEALEKGRALLIAGVFGLAIPLLKDLGLVKITTAAGKVVREGLMPEFSKIFDFLPGLTVGGKAYKMSDFGIKLDHSGVLVAAGAIIGLRVTLSMMLGALILAFWVTPIALASTWTNSAGAVVAAASKPASAWKEIGIWLGAPLLVSSALVSFAFQWRTIARAFKGLGGGGATDDAGARVAAVEAPMSWFPIGTGVAGAGIVVLAWRYFEIPPYYGVLAVLMTFVLALVACRATGETDITPSGAMGKIMQLTYGVLIPQSTTANLMTAGITSGAALSSADLLNDLKSGYLLGANPRRQFLAQFCGIFTGTLASVLGFYILVPEASALVGEGGRDPKFAAPGAQQWRAVAEVFKYGIQNLHPMARTCIGIGLAVGVTMALIEALFPKVKKWLPSASGVGLGLLLPFYNPLAMFLGALLAWAIEKISKRASDRYTIAVASGLIAGESIMGVVVAALNNFVLK